MKRKLSVRQCPWCGNIINSRSYKRHVQQHATKMVHSLGLKTDSDYKREAQLRSNQ